MRPSEGPRVRQGRSITFSANTGLKYEMDLNSQFDVGEVFSLSGASITQLNETNPCPS